MYLYANLRVDECQPFCIKETLATGRKKDDKDIGCGMEDYECAVG